MKIVIALGGNALGHDPVEQLNLVKKTSKIIVDLVSEGNDIIITHGNGPQVGMINLAMDYANANGANTPNMPFAECGAMSQGYIGYHLQQAIQNELYERKIDRECITIVTQVEVNPKDKAFSNPTKPVGMFYTKKEAKIQSQKSGYIMKEDSNRGYRRVVPSPIPKKIVELETIENLINAGKIVITCGGGGIPVIKMKNGYKGIDAVIDKDNSSARLASDLNADMLMILTAVDKVCINFNKKNEKKLDLLTTGEAKNYINENQFAKGSMLPKIEACIKYVTETGNKAIITSLLNAKEALNGNSGTLIKYGELKRTKKNKLEKTGITIFSIMILFLVLIGFITHFLPNLKGMNGTINIGSGVIPASISDILMSPIKGFINISNISLFILILGGFMAIIDYTNAVEEGIKSFLKKTKGREIYIVPILMFIFSIVGTTCGINPAVIAFYGVLSFLMVISKMDTIVSSSIIILGAGSGILGSTINQNKDLALNILNNMNVSINHTFLNFLGIIIWIGTITIATIFVTLYARKVIKKKKSTFLCLQEQKIMEQKYKSDTESTKLSIKSKITLGLVILTFIIMILGFMPFQTWHVNIFNWTGFLTGSNVGSWGYLEVSLFLFIMIFIIGLVNRIKQREFLKIFINGASSVVNVIFTISLAMGVFLLIKDTFLDSYIFANIVKLLQNVPNILFPPLNYLLHILLAIIVPSNDLLGLSLPSIINLFGTSHNIEVLTMTCINASQLVNIFSPTSIVLMAVLSLTSISYNTWFKWIMKILICIFVFTVIILTISNMIL